VLRTTVTGATLRGRTAGEISLRETEASEFAGQSPWTSRDNVEKKKHQQTSEQATEEVERRGTEAHGEEEQLSFRAEDGERPRQRPLNRIDAALVDHRTVLRPETARRGS
jgi:hypothetical protein